MGHFQRWTYLATEVGYMDVYMFIVQEHFHTNTGAGYKYYCLFAHTNV